MGLFPGPADALHRALPGADSAAGTFGRVNGDGQQRRTFMGGTFLIPDVGLILLPEIPNGGQDRVGRGLAQATQRTILDADAQLFQQLDVPLLSFPFADSVEDLHHAGGANPAGDALAAGFPGGKVQEETTQAVEGTGLENREVGVENRRGGSNPSISASQSKVRFALIFLFAVSGNHIQSALQTVCHSRCREPFGIAFQMRIDIGCGGKVAVTEPFLDLLHGDAVGQQ